MFSKNNLSTRKVAILICVNNMELFNRCWMSGKRHLGDSLLYFDNTLANKSVPSVYNEMIGQTESEVLIFVHQDVICGNTWLEKVMEQISIIERRDRRWGILGVMGVRGNGAFVGNIIDPHTERKFGILPCPVRSLDEVCLIIRRESGLMFDESVGGFHLYGADICLQAGLMGMKCYAIDASLKHLSGGQLGKSFHEIAEKLRIKWSAVRRSPFCIETTCGVFLLKNGTTAKVIQKFMMLRRKILRRIQNR